MNIDFTSRLENALREHERERAGLEGSIGRYERGEELGRGGIAVVYRAWDRKLRRDVAMKVLHGHLETSPEARARFQREWQAAARLAHPHIVTVHDAGEDGGRMYLVMELVPGEPLSRILARHRHELRSTVELLEETARAIHYAHEQGVVHRDVKPSNILVTPSGDPKVADFGLARLAQQESLVSTEGATVGTPVYMAPEQVCGGEITPRTDVYALGAVLYEIATGRPPHTGATVNEILAKVLHDDPLSPRRINGDLPRDLEVIALKALEKDPRRRYESALALAEDLRRHLDHRPILAEPPTLWTRAVKRIRRRPTVSALAAALASGLLIVAAIGISARIRHERSVAEKRAEARRAEADGRLSEAAGLFSELRQLQPGDAEAAQKSVELRGRAIEEDKRRRAREIVASASVLQRVEIPRLEEERIRLEEEIRALREGIPSWEGDAKKRPLWEREQRREQVLRDMAALRARVLNDLATAFYLDPEAREPYLEECRRRMAEAERLGDAESEALWSDRIRAAASDEWTAWLDAGGTFEVETSPAGAEVLLFRYEEGEDRRLVPRPCPRPFTGERLGLSPLPATAIPRGSYLLILRFPGTRDVRCPIWIVRGARRVVRATMYPDEGIGEGFVYVPGGPFVYGGDPKADNSIPRDPDAQTGDFFIGKFEVTSGEYLKFLRDRTQHTLAQAIYKMPRETEDQGAFWTVRDQEIVYPDGWRDDLPCIGVSWDNAKEFCEWKTRPAREKGGKVRYRLPTNAEWEKAARGVDGRWFPWGNSFDDSFTLGGRSKPNARDFDSIGAFPKDESPYGVRDMAGSVREYCDDPTVPGDPFVRGGYWQLTGEKAFRLANRWNARVASTPHGFRLVRVPDAP